MLWLLAAWFVASLSGVAHAEPISAAIISSLALTGFAASAVSIAVPVVIGVGISLGLGALTKAVSPKPQVGEPLSGLETNVQIGGDIARQICIGNVGAKGQLVYHNTNGSNNEGYQQVYVLSDWISDGLNGIIIDGLRHLLDLTFDGGYVKEYQTPAYGPLLTIRFYDGTQTAADSELISYSTPAGKWTSNSKLTGMTYVAVFMVYQKDSELYKSGIPKFTFDLRGARLFDPRKAPEVGGTGTHVWSDPTTWEYSENPALASYNYQRGFYRNGQLILGMGTPVYDFLHDTYIAGANICDESVLTTDGFEFRYRVGTILSADESVTHAQTLDVILSTCAGYLYDYGGFYYFQAGAGYASSQTISDGDLVIGQPITFAAKRSRSELFNRIHGQFLDRLNDFETKSYTPQVSSAGLSEDGEELGRSLDLVSVPSQFQAERIAQIRLRECRRQATAGITLGYHMQHLQAGDWITWASARFGTLVWRIQSRSWDPVTKTVSLELAQIDSNVYSWTTADEGGIIPVPGRLTSASLSTTVAGFNVQAIVINDDSGNSWPGLKFTWAATTDPTIDAVIIEYRPISSPELTTRISDPSPTDGFAQSTNGVFGGIDYEARATIATTPPRVTTWTGWVSVSTASTIINIDEFSDTQPDLPTGLVVTSELETQSTGEVNTLVTADWSDIASPNLSYYEVQIKEGTGAFVSFQTATSKYQWRGIKQGTVIKVKVRSISALGTPSAYTAEVTHTVVANTTPSSPITSLSGTGAFQTVFLNWVSPPEKDTDHVEIWEATVNNRASATLVRREPYPSNNAILTGRVPGTHYFYWLRTVNTSGVVSPSFIPASATAGYEVITATLAMTDFGLGIRPVEVVSSLPVTDLSDGRMVFLSTDKKLYRYASFPGTGWTKAVDGADIIANSITAGAIQAGAIVADKLAVGSYAANLAPNPGFEGSISPWTFGGGTAGATAAHLITSNSYSGSGVLELDRTTTSAGSAYSSATLLTQDFIPVERGVSYEVAAAIQGSGNSAGGGFYVTIAWYDANRNSVGQTNAITNAAITTSWVRFQETVVAPDGARYAAPIIYNYITSTARFLRVDEISFRRSIGATIIQDGAIVTRHITVNTLSGDRIQTGTLNADRVQAGSVLASSVVLGGSNTSLGTVDSRAANPLGQANGGTTQLLPGLVSISGGTTLANWRNGGDATKIEGGSIAANTIASNKVTVGNRGISIAGLEFQVNKTTQVVSWAGGFISYINDSGIVQQVSIGASSFSTGGNFTYFYWVKDSGIVSSTTSITVAQGENNVILASYTGAAGLTAFYGNTIIDGDRIVTNSIQANRIQANSITANQLAATTLITATAQIGDLTVSTIKIQDSAISQNINSTAINAAAVSLSLAALERVLLVCTAYTGSEGLTSRGNIIRLARSGTAGYIVQMYMNYGTGTADVTFGSDPQGGAVFVTSVSNKAYYGMSAFQFAHQQSSAGSVTFTLDMSNYEGMVMSISAVSLKK